MPGPYKSPVHAVIELVENGKTVYTLTRRLSGTDKHMAQSLRLVTQGMPTLSIASPHIFVTRIGMSNHGTPIELCGKHTRIESKARRFRVVFPECRLEVIELSGATSYSGPIRGYVMMHVYYDDLEIAKRTTRREAATERQRKRRALEKGSAPSREFLARIATRRETPPENLPEPKKASRIDKDTLDLIEGRLPPPNKKGK